MSRIGLKPISLPEGVSVNLDTKGVAVIKGPKGELSVSYPANYVSVEVKDNEIVVSRHSDEQAYVMNHGTARANLHNAVVGVHEGFKKELEISGIGYRAAKRGDSVVLNVGFSHEVVIKPLPGVTITCPDETHINVEGISKQAVGQTAALIHDTKRPEPYGGKGIHYKGEVIIRKEGKRAAGGKK